jgi:hypothetical protein
MLKDGGFMITEAIVLAIDAEIEQLLKVKALLTGADVAVKRGLGRPAGISAKVKTNANLAGAARKTKSAEPLVPKVAPGSQRHRRRAGQNPIGRQK